MICLSASDLKPGLASVLLPFSAYHYPQLPVENQTDPLPETQCLDKAQPVRVQPPSKDLDTMVLSALTEIGRVDDLLLESPGLHSALEPSAVNRLLYLFGTDMKRLRRRVFFEPIPSHATVRAQPCNTGLAHESLTRVTGVSRDFNQPRDE
jgi:hypothetical protein